MGTSSSFGGIGKGKPTSPSWTGNGGNDGTDNNPDMPDPHDGKPSEPQRPDRETTAQPLTNLRSSRINFGKYASQNRDSHYLRKGVSSYVRHGLGGAKNASSRMATTRKTATSLYNVVQNFVRLGRDEAITLFQLTDLRDQGLQNVFTALADFVCTPGSGLDEAVTRQAYLKTVEQFPTLGIDDQGEMTAAMAEAIVQTFITESIFCRIIVDVGENIRKYAELSSIEQIEQDIHDYIQGAIRQRLQERLSGMDALAQDEVERHIQEVYEDAFEILSGEGE